MHKTTILTLALLAGAVALPATAADRVPLPPDAAAARARAPALTLKRIRADRPRSTASAPKNFGTRVLPGTPMVNAFRAYPPSCAADPLPDKPLGPTYTDTVALYARDDSGGSYTEDVTVTVWRLACSSSGAATDYNPTGAANAITLMRIDRQAAYEGDTEIYPTFPFVQASQAGTGLGGFDSLVRTAIEPNTIVSETPFDSPIVNSTTYVLENYPYEGSGYFTFSDAFTLRIDPVTNDGPVDFAIPAYNPTQATYPAAFQPREIDGYSAAQWINPVLNEGLIMQVTEQPQANGSTVRQVVFDLLLADNNGDPLWLVGNAAFPVGTKSLDIDLAYLGNTGQTSQFPQIPWGTATIEVADCNHVEVTYNSLPQSDASIPVFDGLTVYQRLFAPNGMVCE